MLCRHLRVASLAAKVAGGRKKSAIRQYAEVRGVVGLEMQWAAPGKARADVDAAASRCNRVTT
ncbi:conserved hypothetical protein [Thiomonas arsenitoxydans]|uniref:Uncharacterized protein n=2 Tax=Thiomonas TaxID=32012 RepID=A0A238D3Q5_THIDL|nr:hypothetical protein THI_0609 [Thiomonas arsenitoxydans]SBP87810.1 conserved hypothetical protein [Thiomonas delicata]CAZ90254.1 hypothetical protein THI_3675 [Thiomonas arsenitoxydans]CQR28990.1 conserved hypothetical protein [Thiomonas arsenitoxydans]CQR28992.1 conserved hypothetical protein [Thiomonas arsenitoxydans]